MNEDSAPMPLVITNEHSRRFPRTLQNAFPISEGYRDSIEGPSPEEERARIARRVVDLASWAIVVGFFAYLGWLSWTTPKVPW